MKSNHLIVTAMSVLVLTLCVVTPASAQRPSIADLQAQIAALQANDVPGLADYLTVDTSDPVRPVARFHGVNVQIGNGTGVTPTVNGLGNLIVGYDEPRNEGGAYPAVCSLGLYANEVDCTANGGTWAVNHKSGSHNLIVGLRHAYSRFGGIVAGEANAILATEASVLGGFRNSALDSASTICGGSQNTASGNFASVSGGYQNVASGSAASVSGGGNNTASGIDASVSGGTFNSADGQYASVSGGQGNTAAGTSSSVSGGAGRSVAADDDSGWRAGSLLEDF